MRICILVLAIVLALPRSSLASDALPPAKQVVVLKNNTIPLQMADRQPIATASVSTPEGSGVVRIEKGSRDNQVLVTGLVEGTTDLVLTDTARKALTFKVTVQSNQLYLKVGGTIKLQLTTREPISQAINEKESVARISALPGDPTSVLVTGLAPGITRITLVGADGRKETRQTGH